MDFNDNPEAWSIMMMMMMMAVDTDVNNHDNNADYYINWSWSILLYKDTSISCRIKNYLLSLFYIKHPHTVFFNIMHYHPITSITTINEIAYLNINHHKPVPFNITIFNFTINMKVHPSSCSIILSIYIADSALWIVHSFHNMNSALY